MRAFRLWGVVLLLATVGLIGWLDYWLGPAISLHFLYVLPVAAAGWWMGPTAAVVVVVASTISSTWVDLTGAQGALSGHSLWDALIRVAVFGIVGLGLSRFRHVRKQERKTATVALHTMESRYRLLFNQMLGGFALHEIICDADGVPVDYRFLEANPAFERLTGLKVGQIVGRTVREVLPDIESSWIERYGPVALGGDPIEFEQHSGPLDRDYAVVAFSPVRGQFATMFADITDRKRAEGALRRSERQFRDVFDYAPVGIAQATLAGRFLSANGTLAAMLGYATPAELLGLDVATAVYAEPRDREALLSRLESTGSVTDVEVRWKRKDGTTIWVQLNMTTVKEEQNGARHYYQTFVRDITQRKSLEAQLVQAQKMEAVGRLAGGVAHDFNNLLTVILGEAEMAQEGLSPDHALRPSLEEIQKAGARAAGLTRQLLIFSRKQTVDPTVFSPRDLAGDSEKLLRRLIGEDIQLEMRVAPDTGLVKADRGQIEQVIMNLVVNARDAMPEGGRLVLETTNERLDEEYASYHADVAPGQYVVVSVSDTGAGMSDEVKAHLFEPFFTTKERGSGTGLGLATSYGIVKQAGGHIGVYSEVGTGTTMRVYLPRASDAASGPRPEEAMVRRGTETVLLVEDEAHVRQIAVRMLQAQGYTVIVAADGATALRVIQQESRPIHLLISDVVLPGINGRAVAEQVRALRPKIRTMFISGYTDDMALRQQLVEHGATLVNKPFTAQALARKVREVLDTPGREA